MITMGLAGSGVEEVAESTASAGSNSARRLEKAEAERARTGWCGVEVVLEDEACAGGALRDCTGEWQLRRGALCWAGRMAIEALRRLRLGGSDTRAEKLRLWVVVHLAEAV